MRVHPEEAALLGVYRDIRRLERQAEGWRLMLRARRLIGDEPGFYVEDTAPETVVATLASWVRASDTHTPDAPSEHCDE